MIANALRRKVGNALRDVASRFVGMEPVTRHELAMALIDIARRIEPPNPTHPRVP